MGLDNYGDPDRRDDYGRYVAPIGAASKIDRRLVRDSTSEDRLSWIAEVSRDRYTKLLAKQRKYFRLLAEGEDYKARKLIGEFIHDSNNALTVIESVARMGIEAGPQVVKRDLGESA